MEKHAIAYTGWEDMDRGPCPYNGGIAAADSFQLPADLLPDSDADSDAEYDLSGENGYEAEEYDGAEGFWDAEGSTAPPSYYGPGPSTFAGAYHPGPSTFTGGYDPDPYGDGMALDDAPFAPQLDPRLFRANLRQGSVELSIG